MPAWLNERGRCPLGHGWRWNEPWAVSRDEERALIARAIETFERTSMAVAVHARWSGQAARSAAIRQFIEHAQAIPGVRFMRRADIARWWLDTYPPATNGSSR